MDGVMPGVMIILITHSSHLIIAKILSSDDISMWIIMTLLQQERTETVPWRLKEAAINVVALGKAQKTSHQRDSGT